MIKKLAKYGKILMALTLISALTLPSYATVGASDGSAFVTKAEFDAALSDFNARLTTFEAGINSKIDSQVSSYLDRNGIWQGKVQPMLTTSFDYGVKASGEIGTQWYNMFATKEQLSMGQGLNLSSSSSNRIVKNCDDTSYLFLQNVTKTGLCFVACADGGIANGDYNAVVVVTTTTRINLANVYWNYSCDVSIQGGKWETKTGIEKYHLNTLLTGWGTGTSLVLPTLPIVSILFFVQKGDDVWIDLKQTVNDYTSAGNDYCTLGFYRNDAKSIRTYSFKSATIY